MKSNATANYDVQFVDIEQNPDAGPTHCPLWSKWLARPSRSSTSAECVDHITPVSGPNDPLFWDESNHQSLCWSCHSKKTVQDTKNGKTR